MKSSTNSSILLLLVRLPVVFLGFPFCNTRKILFGSLCVPQPCRRLEPNSLQNLLLKVVVVQLLKDDDEKHMRFDDGANFVDAFEWIDAWHACLLSCRCAPQHNADFMHGAISQTKIRIPLSELCIQSLAFNFSIIALDCGCQLIWNIIQLAEVIITAPSMPFPHILSFELFK